MKSYHIPKLHFNHPLNKRYAFCFHGDNVTNDKEKVTCIICNRMIEKDEIKDSEEI